MDTRPFRLCSSWMTAAVIVCRKIEKAIVEHGRMTVTQYRVLCDVASAGGQVRVGKIARTLALHASAITSAANKLADDGLIVREDDPEDRRIVLLAITELGRGRLGIVDRFLHEWLGTLWGPLTESQRQLLVRSTSAAAQFRGELRRDHSGLLGQTAFITTSLTFYHNASKAARDYGNVSFCEFRILFELKEYANGARVGEIADSLSLRSAEISAATDELCRRGLIKRSRDCVDRRVIILEITNEGAAVVDRVTPAIGLVYAATGQSFSDDNDELITIAEAVLRGLGANRF